MELFTKLRDLTGGVSNELLEDGQLGRGIIVSIKQTSVSTGADNGVGGDVFSVCVFMVERIALSPGEEPPTVTVASTGDPNTRSAARILSEGLPCKAVIVQSQPLGMRSSTGKEMFAFVLTVLAEGRRPYQIQVGNPVPSDAIPLLYPGNTVPAKRMPDGDDRELAIDWDAALAQLPTATAS